jgi:hypothetical protein
LVLVLVGVVLALLGGAAVVPDVVAGFGTAPPLAYIGFGAGLFLTGFGAIFLINRDKADLLRIEDGQLLVRCLDGSEVRVPLASLANALPRMGGNRSFVAVLQKHDGGVIELCATADEADALRITEPIQRHIDARAGADPRDDDLPPDPLERLTGLAHVQASRQGDALEVSWSGSGATALWLALFGPLAGMGFVVLGFHINGPSVGTFIAIAFVGLLVGLTLWSIVRQIGVTQRLRIDDCAETDGSASRRRPSSRWSPSTTPISCKSSAASCCFASDLLRTCSTVSAATPSKLKATRTAPPRSRWLAVCCTYSATPSTSRPAR